MVGGGDSPRVGGSRMKAAFNRLVLAIWCATPSQWVKLLRAAK